MTVALRPEIQFSPTGLTLPPDLSIEEWTDYGERLFSMERGVMWAIGDWWHYGERRYGELAAQALNGHYAYGTFKNASWVAGAIEQSRRRDLLTFAHHQDVAPLPPKEQDYWLDQAERGQWSRTELRQRIKRGQTEDEPIPDTDPDHWHALADVLDHVGTLLMRDTAAIAEAVPSRRRLATARRLRKLGLGLGRIAWKLEGIEEDRDDDDAATA